ncbi:cytochrome P450 6k1-like [Pieris brassicae]|uniref:cytochrome P450 6k1-like n=1 Tax=Pieris brassicae TaxID=7116 RepID=UPI001E65E642|nr:cytochrome P450 6k1-like [Pieris brassicae]
MFVVLFCAIVLCVVAWVYLRWSKVKQYWADKGVPHHPPHPIFGSLGFLQKKNFSIWLIETIRHFKSPYVGIWLFWRPAIIINSPEIARNILVKDFGSFRNRFVAAGPGDPIGLNLLTANDPLWSSIRRRLTTIFTASKLRALQNLFDTKTSELIQRIDNTEDKTKISVRMLCTDYTTDVIGTASFGVKTNATLTGEDPIRTVTKSFMDFDLLRGISWSAIFFFPEVAELFSFKMFPKKSTDFFKRIYLTVSKQRQQQNVPGSAPKDLLDALISLKENVGGPNEELSDDTIVAQAVAFLFAGYETSGSSLAFALYELAFYPEIQEKLYAELVEAKAKCANDSLDINTLADLQYLNCVIKEALRKYSPMGWMDRVALVDYKIDDKLSIPAGTPLYVNAIGMQYYEEFYPEPEKFDPDRFLPENEKESLQFTYLPFGEGPRNCIGKRFAQISLRSSLAKLVLNYKFRPLPGQPKPSEIDVDKVGLFFVPSHHLYLDFIRR